MCDSGLFGSESEVHLDWVRGNEHTAKRRPKVEGISARGADIPGSVGRRGRVAMPPAQAARNPLV